MNPTVNLKVLWPPPLKRQRSGRPLEGGGAAFGQPLARELTTLKRASEPAVHAEAGMNRFVLGLGLLLTLAIGGCDNLAQLMAKPKPPPRAPVPHVVAAAKPSALPEEAPVPSSDHYGMPFAWEKGHDEPLSFARSFVSDVLRDNQNYRLHAKANFEGSLKSQTPRATVVTCADSRVQVEAWDATPENDDFTVRNIGNQVSTSLGSVQYGVEQLKTPVLLILGHTGCEAIRAAFENPANLPESISKEISALRANVEDSHSKAGSTMVNAVVTNVHQQVRFALEKFGPRVVTGKLTVVGAVYDLRDDLGKGLARISIVNVNGNSEARRLRAFVEAIQGNKALDSGKLATPGSLQGPDSDAQEPEAKEGKSEVLDPIAEDLRAAFASLSEKLDKPPVHTKHK